MKTREEIEQEYERDSRAIWEDYKTKTRVLITNRNDNLHAAEVRRDAALADAALAELDDPMARLIAAGRRAMKSHNGAGECRCGQCIEILNAIDYAEQRRAQG